MFNRLFLALPLLLLAACSTTSDFSRGMGEPLKVLNQAAAIADGAESDVLRAHALGMSGTQSPLSDSVCVKWAGPSVTQSGLALFADAYETVGKVAEKPTDTSYAGYIQKFRENTENGAELDVKTEQEKARQKAIAKMDRCKLLFLADIGPGVSLAPLPTRAAALPEIFGTVLALDKLIKAGLALMEAAQREAAVRATISGLIPQMREAQQSLSAPVTAAFGPVVRFPDVTAQPVLAMNSSAVGATITIRRWFVAQQIVGQWAYLQPCRERKRANCLGEPEVNRVVNKLVENVARYRALSRIDSTKVLSSVDAAINAAEASLQTGKNPANLIDALVGLADAVSTISDAYVAYDATKD